MKLYHCENSRSLRVIWAMEELGVEGEVVKLAFPPRARQTDYLAVNPTGTIPWLVDGETAMSESMAIVEWLAEQAPANDLTVAPGAAGRADYLNFVFMGEATLVPPLTAIVRYRMLEPPARRLPQAAEDGADVFLDRLGLVEARLADAEWMAAGRFTCADISVGYALFLGAFLRLAGRYAPAVAAYLERLKARPAFQRALARN